MVRNSIAVATNSTGLADHTSSESNTQLPQLPVNISFGGDWVWRKTTV